MKRNGARQFIGTMAAATLLLAGSATSGYALSFDLSDEVSMDLDTSITYSAAWRAKDRDDDQLNTSVGFGQLGNGDDGNRAFDKGDMINNRFSALIDMDLSWGDYGVFARGSGFYDFVYMGESNWEGDESLNNNHYTNGGPLTNADEFTDKTKDRHGRTAELMDLFLYGSGEFGMNPYSFQIGRQVISWGESLFVAGGISAAQAPMDFSKANVPGVELKDVFLPVGLASAQITLGENYTLAGYYGWEWEPARFDEAGSFFSAVDLIDEAGDRFIFAPAGPSIDRVDDKDPDEEGQWGLSFRYLADWLNDTEFGFYYINYHETVPLLEINYGGGTMAPITDLFGNDWSNVDPVGGGTLNLLDTSSYNLGYAEDVKLLGASFSTVVGDHNVSGEVSYRENLPVPVKGTQLDNAFSLVWEEAPVLQAQISTFSIWGDNWFSEGLSLATEVGFVNVNGMENDQLFFDKFAWGGAAKLQFEYYGLMSGLDMKIPITYKFNPNGVSSTYLGLLFHEHADSVAIAFDFTYDSVWTFGVGYTEFIGNYQDQNKNDRDFCTFNIKRVF